MRLPLVILMLVLIISCNKKSNSNNLKSCRIDSIVGVDYNYSAVFSYLGDSVCLVNPEPSLYFKKSRITFKFGKISEQIVYLFPDAPNQKYEYIYSGEQLVSIKLFNYYPDPLIPKIYLSADFSFQNNLPLKANLSYWVSDTIFGKSSLSFFSKDGKNIDSCSKGFNYGFTYEINHNKKNMFKSNDVFFMDPFIEKPNQFYDYCALIVKYYNENETDVMHVIEIPSKLYQNIAIPNSSGLIGEVKDKFYTRKYFYNCLF